MEKNQVIHGYTYRPTYRNPDNQHHHGMYANRMDHIMSHREVIMLIMSILATPLIVGTSMLVGLAASAIHEMIQKKTSVRDETPEAQPEEDTSHHEEPQATPPHHHDRHHNDTMARMTWGGDSLNSLRFILYRAIAGQDHHKVKMIPPHLKLGPVDQGTTVPSLPTSLHIHPVGRHGHRGTTLRGREDDNDDQARRPSMKKAMKQTLHMIKHLHNSKGESQTRHAGATCRLSGQEEEIIRTEIKKVIRDPPGDRYNPQAPDTRGQLHAGTGHSPRGVYGQKKMGHPL